jgi:hypothetical protein
MKPWKVILLSVAVVAGLLCLWQLVRYLKMARYPVHGPDVSHYQSRAGWKAVCSCYEFTFFKGAENYS